MLFQPDHEDKLLGRLGAQGQSTTSTDDEMIEAQIFEALDWLKTCGSTHDAFTLCSCCESIRADIILLRKEQRMARGDFIGAQRLMR